MDVSLENNETQKKCLEMELLHSVQQNHVLKEHFLSHRVLYVENKNNKMKKQNKKESFKKKKIVTVKASKRKLYNTKKRIYKIK